MITLGYKRDMTVYNELYYGIELVVYRPAMGGERPGDMKPEPRY